MYTKLNLLPAKVASKGAIKRELNCVAFYGDKTVATDSFRALEVEAEGEKLEKPLLFQADAVKSFKPAKGVIKFEAEDMPVRDMSEDVGMFPDVLPLIDNAEKYEEYVEVNINGKLLGEMLQLMAKGNKLGRVKMRVPEGPGRAVYLYTEDGPQKMRGLVMPMNK